MPPVPSETVSQTGPLPEQACGGVRWGFVAGPPAYLQCPPCLPLVPRIPLTVAAESLALDLPEGTLVTQHQGPAGVHGEAALRLVTDAVASPGHGPPLSAHVVPGDRVVIAIAGVIPQAAAVEGAVVGCLQDAGVEPAEIMVLRASALEPGASREPAEPAAGLFDPSAESATAYLAADAEARPLYLARALVDADVVVAMGSFGWDAAIGGRSIEGELWPSFGRSENLDQLLVDVARRGQRGLVDWRSSLHDITWQLGVCASLRLVAGRSGSLHAACFGLPEEATRMARDAAAGWRPAVGEAADLTVATLSSGAASLTAAIRAIAAAARLTHPEGTICLLGPVGATPGIVLTRWRQGVPLPLLLREAVAARDPVLLADALQTRHLARALGERRLVLCCGMAESVVEDLGFGHASDPAVIERLAHQADHVALLHEADRMLPRI